MTIMYRVKNTLTTAKIKSVDYHYDEFRIVFCGVSNAIILEMKTDDSTAETIQTELLTKGYCNLMRFPKKIIFSQ